MVREKFPHCNKVHVSHYFCTAFILFNIIYQFICHILTFQLWEDIVSGRAINNPSLLTRFTILTFAVRQLIEDVLDAVYDNFCQSFLSQFQRAFGRRQAEKSMFSFVRSDFKCLCIMIIPMFAPKTEPF